jgi:5-methylcytosine-specific restriction enzyme A
MTKRDMLGSIQGDKAAGDIWAVIERDASFTKAEGNNKMRREIDRDLGPVLEGLAPERRVMVRRWAYGLAAAFVRTRQEDGKLICDDCGFDAGCRAAGTGVKPPSLLDVHHRDPLAEGKRLTSLSDFILLYITMSHLPSVHARPYPSERYPRFGPIPR